MGTLLLEKHFKQIGARVVLNEIKPRSLQRAGIDILSDKAGEYYEIRLAPDQPVQYEAVDLQPRLRHLLLLARYENGRKDKFLCGHDERHWFVCGVPDRWGIASVVQAMQALQPLEVSVEAQRTIKRPQARLSRRNKVFVRQGEWFFLPEAELVVDERLIHRSEPIMRSSGGKPHYCQQLYRMGGEQVMVCRAYRQGISMSEYRRLLESRPEMAKLNWRAMRRGAAAFVRGRISHPDHKTIVLPFWHRVLMNTENEAPGFSHVAFLD